MKLTVSKIREFWKDPVCSKIIATGLIGLFVLLLPGLYRHSTYREKENQVIEERVRRFDNSTWTGSASAIEIPGEQVTLKPFQITYHFQVKNREVTGIGYFEHDGQRFEVTLKGDFYNESLIRFEYYHLKGINAFGYVILALDQVPTRMNGKCVVYGSITHRVSVGSLELQKVEH